jgi:hypothetical protein
MSRGRDAHIVAAFQFVRKHARISQHGITYSLIDPELITDHCCVASSSCSHLYSSQNRVSVTEETHRQQTTARPDMALERMIGSLLPLAPPITLRRMFTLLFFQPTPQQHSPVRH